LTSSDILTSIKPIIEVVNDIGENRFIIKIKNSSKEKKEPKKPYNLNTESEPIINIGFDTEDDSMANPHLLIYYYNKKYYVFKDKISALYWLLFSKFESQVIIWCVNTEYDLNNLTYPYNFLIDRLYAKGRFIMGQPFFNRQIRFYDLINFYSLSAEKIGNLFGVKKLSFDFKRTKDKNGKLIVTQNEITYCKRDAKIAGIAGQYIVDKFKDFNIRQSATTPSCALKIFNKHYSPIDLFHYNQNNYILKKSDLEVLKNSYYGGRVEAFYIGYYQSKNIKYYDVNSLYPYVMKNYTYPNPFSRVIVGKNENINNGIIDCLVDIPVDNYVGLLPVRDKKLLFPVGSIRGCWAMPELINAVNNGCKILKIYKSIEYETVIDLFSGYINDMYKKRLQAKIPSDNYFYKILMNSLYGKFAQRDIYTRYVHVSENKEPFKKILYDYAVLEDSIPAFHNNVVVASYVTSYARYELYNYMKQIIDKGGKLLYCDTDSIIYDGNFDLLTSKNLGDMKLEYKIDNITILGNKMYCFQDKNKDYHYVYKGVPKHLQKEMFEHDIVYYKKPIRYLESQRRLNKNFIPNYWIDYSKKRLTKYDKRIILKDGNTKPLVFNN